AVAEAEIGTGEGLAVEGLAVEGLATEALASEGPAILVLASQNWHPGVVGLVAARLRERFNRPSFAIAMRADGTGTGSGRSISGVDLGAGILQAVNEGIIEKGGGHAMAAGISLKQSQLANFRSFITQTLAKDVDLARQNSSIKIDAAITARTASVDFVNSLEALGPFGMGNASPIFALASHKITYADIVGKGGHVRCTLSSGDGATIKAIAFRAATSEMGKALLNASRDQPLHFCGTLNVDHWQGRQRVQMRLIDAADPEKSYR
ncbi:Single-stranded-DNA-specific exonuclease RecJ, partial [hydrothermal vent metagenome]